MADKFWVRVYGEPFVSSNMTKSFPLMSVVMAPGAKAMLEEKAADYAVRDAEMPEPEQVTRFEYAAEHALDYRLSLDLMVNPAKVQQWMNRGFTRDKAEAAVRYGVVIVEVLLDASRAVEFKMRYAAI